MDVIVKAKLTQNSSNKFYINIKMNLFKN